jgi:hypothetical protein
LFDEEDLFNGEDEGQWAEKNQTYDDTNDDDMDDQDDKDTDNSYWEDVINDNIAHGDERGLYEDDEEASYDDDDDDEEYLLGVYNEISDDEVEDLSSDYEKPSHQEDDLADDRACDAIGHKGDSPDCHLDQELLEEGSNDGDSDGINSTGWDFSDDDDYQSPEDEEEYSPHWTNPCMVGHLMASTCRTVTNPGRISTSGSTCSQPTEARPRTRTRTPLTSQTRNTLHYLQSRHLTFHLRLIHELRCHIRCPLASTASGTLPTTTRNGNKARMSFPTMATRSFRTRKSELT